MCWTHRALLPAIVFSCLLLTAACRSTQTSDRPPEQPRPTHTPLPTHTPFPTARRQPVLNIIPPRASLLFDGATQEAGIGTYCWQEADAGLCADTAGVTTPKRPLVVPSDVVVTLRLPLPQAPSGVSMAVARVTDADATEYRSAQYRAWSKPLGADTRLLAQPEQPIELELEPGLHVLSIFAGWSGVGDVSYGFLLEVQ